MAWTEKSKYQPPYSKEIQDWLDQGGKITVVPPKESAEKLEKMRGQKYKGPEIMYRRNKTEEEE
jgi:hypothetical protein